MAHMKTHQMFQQDLSYAKYLQQVNKALISYKDTSMAQNIPPYLDQTSYGSTIGDLDCSSCKNTPEAQIQRLQVSAQFILAESGHINPLKAQVYTTVDGRSLASPHIYSAAIFPHRFWYGRPGRISIINSMELLGAFGKQDFRPGTSEAGARH